MKVMKRLRSAIENYKAPEEILRFFESEMLKDGLVSERLDVLKQPETRPRTRWLPWWSIQMIYFIFGSRAVVVFLVPILWPDNKVIPLVLGDGISALGVAVRQMWYSLSFNYSVLFASIRFLIKRSEGKRKLQFMTDFSPEWAAHHEQQKLKLKLNLLFIGYKYFNYIIYATIVASLTLAIFMDTMAKQSLPHLVFNLLWAAINCAWMLFAPSILMELFVFTWLATRVSCIWLKQTHETSERILQQHRPNRVSMKVKWMILKFSSEFYTSVAIVQKYNACIKQILQLFRTLFLPICAANIYVHFTGTYPNLVSRFLVLSLTLNQLVVIFLFMSLAPLPYNKSVPIADNVFSMLARMKNELSLGQKRSLIRILKKVTNERYPVGYTCGDIFWFSSKTMMDFLFEIASCAILSLEMIIKI